MKSKIIGVIAVVASFGIGFAIPNVASAVNQIDSYEEAKAIVEGTKVSENNESSGVSEQASIEAEKEAGSEEDLANQESSFEDVNEVNSNVSTADKEPQTVINSDADVVLGFTFDDIEVNGIKFVEADYDSMLDSFGLDKTQVEYTDGGFKINTDPVEWNGKKVYYYGGYADDNGVSQSLYWDGEKYVTWDLEEKESTRYNINISGSWEDKDNYSDYWNFGYGTEIQNNNSLYDSLYLGNYEHGLSDEDKKEIDSFFTAPFTGGDYAAMNEVMHTDEMLQKGMKDVSGSRENYDRYIVDTSLGKCSLSVSTSESEKGTNTGYYYEFESGKYAVYIGFREGIDSATSINYNYRH